MGQIIFKKNVSGTVGGGLFLVAIGVFLYGAVEPAFRPLVIGSLVGGSA